MALAFYTKIVVLRGALRTWKKKMTDALIDAAKKNDVALVKEFIGRGIDVNGVYVNGWTALYWAARRGFVECSKVLLEANAEVNRVDDDGWTPLHTTSYYGHVECVKVWWWCDILSFVWMKKTISHFCCCAAPHRLEGQRECQNIPWRFSSAVSCHGRTLSVR